jgi:cytidylate kinase
MGSSNVTVEKFVTEQRAMFDNSLTEEDLEKKISVPAITLSMEAGSGGYLIAEELAKRLDFELYSRNILNAVSHSADVSSNALDLIEKERFGRLQDFVSSLVSDTYVYSGDYLHHLTKVVNALGIIGRAVIVGRGANFILPPEKRFAIRVVAPEEVREKNVAFHFGVSIVDARKRIKHRDSRRKTFVREAFRKDITAWKHYDLIINTERLDLDAAVETAVGTILGAQKNQAFEKSTSYILRRKK